MKGFLFLLIFSSIFFFGKTQDLERCFQENFEETKLEDAIFTTQKFYLLQDSSVLFRKIKLISAKKNVVSDQGNLFLLSYLRTLYLNSGKQRNSISVKQDYIKLIKDIQSSENNSSKQENLLALVYQSLAGFLLLEEENKERFALRYYLKSEMLFKKIGYDKASMSFQALSNLGEFYLRMREYSTSMFYLNQAEKYIEKEKWNWSKINFYNNKGLCFGYMRESQKAIESYKRILDFVSEEKDRVWFGISHGNQAAELYKLMRLKEADSCLQIDLSYSLKYNERESTFETLCLLMDIASKNKNFTKAAYYDSEILKMKDLFEDKRLQQTYCLKKAIYLFESGKHKEAYIFYNKGIEIKNELQKKLKKNQILTGAREFELELKQSRMDKLNLEKENSIFQRNLFIVILILSLVTVYFVFKSISANNKRKENELKFKQELLQKELQTAEKELSLFKENRSKQNEFIESIKSELESLKSENSSFDKMEFIEKLNNSVIVTQQDWLQFSTLFNQVHPKFIDLLKQNFSQLTANEVRILVLTKLDYSTKEMASMLGVSLDAIHKSRYRLRKKLELPEEDNFSNLIEKITELTKS
jgi:tetratricopeptide (TPR) repeat protein